MAEEPFEVVEGALGIFYSVMEKPGADGIPVHSKLDQKLADSKWRCLVGDVQCSQIIGPNYETGYFTVSATATFFETMVGGTPDAGLPAEN